MAKKVLVVDDEKLIVKGIRFSLEQDDYEVSCAYDGEEALQMAKETEYDIILLDLMLPKLSGLEVCQQIRGFSNVPIIMLTAKGEDMDKIMGLEYGADDYITKPFNILEVKARIKAILRRVSKPAQKEEQPKQIEVAGLKMDCEARRVYVNGKEINLTAKEFDVLELLAGAMSIRVMSVQWMSISAVSARKSRRIPASRNMCTQNGASATTSRRDSIRGRRGRLHVPRAVRQAEDAEVTGYAS